jgi:glycosyltransferase involved in cell wall biosynthesis
VRVLLDATPARRGTTGTAVYVSRLTGALGEIGVEVMPVVNERREAPGGGRRRSLANLAEDVRWTQVDLPLIAQRAGVDVIHHALPALCRASPCTQVVTVHDVAFERLPWAFDPGFRAWARRAHRRAARGAAAVITPSRTTALDVRTLWGVEPDRLVLAPHGPGQEPDGPRERGADLHLLYVGDSEPRKNLGLLLGAYRRYRERAEDPLPLVLAGALEPAAAGGVEGVWVVKDASAERLGRLYDEAVALVHPALHEGFGLTLLEAMSAGVPVLAARSPGVTEIAAEAARYFDPRDVEGLASALGELAADAPGRRDLAERGRRRAAEFSWARSARAHRAAYTLALAGRAAQPAPQPARA